MNDLICISHLRWDFVRQRPQHLLSRLSRQGRVLFVEEPLSNTEATTPHLEVYKGQGAANVTVIRLIQPAEEHRWIGHNDPLTQGTYSLLLRRYLESKRFTDAILWLYTPMAAPFVDTIKHKLLVVDVMDQLSAFKGAPVALVQQEQTLLPRADLVFTGGISLYHSKLPFNKNTYLFPSGVEIEHFAKATKSTAFERPADMQDIQSPVLGYFGVIDERMDLETLAYTAEMQPEWNLVLVGPVVKISPDDLPKAPNIHYLGAKKYEELPAYLAHFDVALVPFARNEATEYLSPTKTLEYMAAHKPIVSTPINDVIELYGDVVRIAYTPQQFVQQVESALEDHSAERCTVEDKLLARHTWDNIAERISHIMAAHLNKVPAVQHAATSQEMSAAV